MTPFSDTDTDNGYLGKNFHLDCGGLFVGQIDAFGESSSSPEKWPKSEMNSPKLPSNLPIMTVTDP